MKRILIIFALLSAFVLPAQVAQADSFTASGNLFDQLKTITGQNATNLWTYLPGGQAFDIAVMFASDDVDPFAGTGSNLGGLNVLLSTMATDFFSNVNEAYASSGGAVAYEYNGATVELTGGTIFVSAQINNVDYVFALSPTSKGSFNPVPVPAAAVLFGSGLVGIIALRRKMK